MNNKQDINQNEEYNIFKISFINKEYNSHIHFGKL